MLTVSRRFRFSSSFTENSGKFYGFNFELWVTLAGKLDPVTGFICHLSTVKEILDPIIDKLDHQHLNDVTLSPNFIQTKTAEFNMPIGNTSDCLKIDGHSQNTHTSFDLFSFLNDLIKIMSTSLHEHGLSLIECTLNLPKNLQLCYSEGNVTISYKKQIVFPKGDRESIKWSVGKLKIEFVSDKNIRDVDTLFSSLDTDFLENMQEDSRQFMVEMDDLTKLKKCESRQNETSTQEPIIQEPFCKRYSYEKFCSELYVTRLMNAFKKNKNIQIEAIQLESEDGYVYRAHTSGQFHGFNMTTYSGHSLNQPTLTHTVSETIFGPCSNKHGHNFKFGFMIKTNTNLIEQDITNIKNQFSNLEEALLFFKGLENSWLNNKIPVTPCTGENMISWLANRFEFLEHIICIETENNQFNWTKK